MSRTTWGAIAGIIIAGFLSGFVAGAAGFGPAATGGLGLAVEGPVVIAALLLTLGRQVPRAERPRALSRR